MTKRNIELLSNKDMYVKYADVVEVVRNAKIAILHSGKQNMVQYHGLKEDKNIFRIFSATPNVKGIEKFTGIIHELAHVLFESPFKATKKLFKDNWNLNNEEYKFFFNVFNVLEDQRIESQMGKMYLKHAGRFNKTTKALGKLMGNNMRNKNPIDILLTIRFQRGKDIMNSTENYDVYAKALEDVVLTDKFGALRVIVSIKPYLDKYLSDRSVDKNDELSWMKVKEETNRENEDFSKNDLRSSGETNLDVPEELLDPDENTEESNKSIIDIGKEDGEDVVNQVIDSLRADEIIKQPLPKRVIMVDRDHHPIRPNMKISKGLSKVFRTLMMQKKDFIDNEGEEVDVDTYVESLIRGNDLSNCRVNRKTTNGVSLVISIDASSSMAGERITTARNLVATLYESVKGVDNVEIRANVWGANGQGMIGMTEINNKTDINQITCKRSYSVTPTHMALEYSGKMLKQMKGAKKMMIMITDGHPNYYVGGYHMSAPNYFSTCKKSMVKLRHVTDNVNCVVLQDAYQFKYNPVRKLFKSKSIMRVESMNDASEKVIKQFKRMVMSSFV